MSAAKYKFTNWAGNQSCSPERFIQPTTTAEIISIVKAAASEGRKIRVVGSGHSWSDIVCTSDWLLNLDHLNKFINFDKEAGEFTAEAGIKLKDLNVLLHEQGMGLPVLGSISEQSLAGAISTGTHSTGIRYGSLSTFITEVKMVTATGDEMVINQQQNSHLLPAVKISLGCLGIITQITMKCVPSFNLCEESYPQPFDKAVAEMPEILKKYDHVKYWWFPHSPNLQVYCYTRTQDPCKRLSLIDQWGQDSWFSRLFINTALAATVRFPAVIPAMNRFISRTVFTKKYRVEEAPKVFNVPSPPIHNEGEYAIPVEKAQEALNAVRQMVEERFRVNFIMEVRFAKADDIWLSGSYGRDVCYMGPYMHGQSGWREYMLAFEELMSRYGGRPHWGKEFSLSSQQLQERIPKLDEFRKIKEQLDPQGMFSNYYIERVFS